jgi:hypothetical protein
MGEESIRELLRKKKVLRDDVSKFRNPDPNSGDIGVEKSGEPAKNFLPPMSGPPDRDPTKNPFRNAPASPGKRMNKTRNPVKDT